jgi:hypothetical protein
MDFSIEFGGYPQDITVTLTGVATPVDFHRYNEALSADPRFRTGMTILVDASALDASQLAEEELRAAASPLAERDWLHPPLAIAVVAPDPETFSALRLGQAHLGGSGARRRTFTTIDEALAWLSEQRGSDR